MPSSRAFPLCLLLALVCALCLPLAFHRGESNYTFDEANYYLPAVAQIRPVWPHLDLVRDSFSATAPGYSYFLAGLSLLTGQERIVLRLVTLILSLGVLVMLWFAWDGATSPWTRFAALLPLAGSNFFIKSASYIVTDNPALLLTAGVLVLTLTGKSPAALPAAGLLAAGSVFLRQITGWLEVPLFLRAVRRPAHLWVVLPALAVLGLLIHAWGGLVPPAWQTQHRGEIAYAAGAYQLALLALMGPFFHAAAGGSWREAGRSPWVWAGATLGLVLALAGPTNASHEAGRWGGYLWNISAHFPSPGQRSLFFLALAPVGGAMLGQLARILWRDAGQLAALPWFAALLAFLAAGLSNRQVYHRYFEPTLLVFLMLWLVLLAPHRRELFRRPLLWLGSGQVLLTLLTAHLRTFGPA